MSDAVVTGNIYDGRMDAPVSRQNSQTTDASLMSAYAKGDAAAFDTLYYRHKDKLYRFMYRQLDADSIVDELYQDVWSSVIRAREDYRDTAAFSTWLYSIARNRIIDYFRSQNRQREVIEVKEDIDEYSAAKHQEPQQVGVNQQLVQRLKELIGDLPPPQREAFLLKEEAGLSLAEIADVAGVDRETIKSRLRYAVNKLRKQLTIDYGRPDAE